MTTASELLDTAPDEQITRARLIYKAIANGEWELACWYLENAVREESASAWGLDAADLLNQCQRNVK